MATSIVPPVEEARDAATTATRPTPPAESDAAGPLAPLLDARWALGWRHVAACSWFCALFLYFSYIPLFHSDLWGHVHYGKWMLEHRTLVDQDPFMPLAEGMHSANNAWLSQVVMAKLHELGGPHFLSILFAVVAVGAYLVHARTMYLLSGRLAFAVLGTMLLLAIGWSRHAIVRPEIFGNLSFALLLWLVVSGGDQAPRRLDAGRDGAADDPTRDGFGWRLWFGAPLLMLAWVNLHGSFAVGLVFLGCQLVAVTVEEAWRTRSVLGLLQSRRFQRWAILMQLCMAATLVNPYGLDMLIETVRFGKNPNLKDVLEWYPLKLIDMEGVQFGVSAVLLLVALRWSRRRIQLVDVLLFTVFLAAMAPTIRMIAWYAPVFVYLWTPHAADAWSRIERLVRPHWESLRAVVVSAFAADETTAESAPGALAGESAASDTSDASAPRADSPTDASPESSLDAATPASVSDAETRPAIRFAGTLACGLMIWTTFAFSPISQPILGGRLRPANRVYSRGTPLSVTEYLREHPRDGLIFGPQWWGDWIAWDGPPGAKVFMTTHVHLAPQTVWKDYLRVARGLTGWQQTLDRYRVDTLIVDKTLQPALVDGVRGSEAWQTVFENDEAMIVERRASRAAAAIAPSTESDAPVEPAAPETEEPAEPAAGAAAERSPS